MKPTLTLLTVLLLAPLAALHHAGNFKRWKTPRRKFPVIGKLLRDDFQ